MNLSTIIAVASGGAVGATLRLLINTGIANKGYNVHFPLGTLIVNLLGALLIGMLFAYFHYNTDIPSALKTFLITGFLGALTTYSTFAIESFFLLEAGNYTQAFANMALNLFGTILFAGLGYITILHFTK
ncbi:CrcB protein [hydrothermal vent metagenome]|uniref:CrcB protein n=1 Tax=hydrothermal vent metagenome TaxID=652676 RepID=A0A1W1CVP6_9ZZZZ